MYIYTPVHTFIHSHLHTHTQAHTNTHTHTHIHTQHTQTCMHMHTSMNIRGGLYLCCLHHNVNFYFVVGKSYFIYMEYIELVSKEIILDYCL